MGSCENPIFFRGYRYDDLIESIHYTQVPNQWGKIFFKSSSSDNIIENAVILNAQTAIQIGEPGQNGTTLQLSHTKMTYSGKANLLGYDSEIKLTNCLLANSNQQIVLFGGKIDVLHCTIVNYNEWRKDFSNRAIHLNDVDSLEANYNLGISTIQNSIIYGPSNEELAYPSDDINTYFEITSSIVKTNAVATGLINEDPLFEKVDSFEYNYLLKENSPAINAGTIIEYELPLYDLNCVLRDAIPDMGAYEFQEQIEP
jgi:hypothetical protein